MKREHKATAAAFRQALNHCRIGLATKQMFNLSDIGRYFGVTLSIKPFEQTSPLTIRDFNSFVAPALEALHKRGDSPTIPPVSQPSSNGGQVIDIKATPILKPDALDEVKSVYEEHPLDKLNWIPPPNPLQIAKLYPAQLKATKDLAYKLCIEKRRGVLLRASVGVGKTYMYGQLIRWLFDQKELFAGCISPWPCLIITKASIVEQTRRVMVNEFGLDGIRQVSVINYDALRSSKGLETMIELRYEVHGGIRYETYKWRPYLNPRLVIVDECQAAKNEDSAQAKITRALGQLPPDQGVKVVFSSATPFTRVSEAKYLAVNVGAPYRML